MEDTHQYWNYLWDSFHLNWFSNNSFSFQVFDSNVKSEKLLRFKLGRGKVIKVSAHSFHCETQFIHYYLNNTVIAIGIQQKMAIGQACPTQSNVLEPTLRPAGPALILPTLHTAILWG